MLRLVALTTNYFSSFSKTAGAYDYVGWSVGAVVLGCVLTCPPEGNVLLLFCYSIPIQFVCDSSEVACSYFFFLGIVLTQFYGEPSSVHCKHMIVSGARLAACTCSGWKVETLTLLRKSGRVFTIFNTSLVNFSKLVAELDRK